MDNEGNDFEMTRAGELVAFKPAVEWKDEEKIEDYIERLGFAPDREHYIGNLDTDHLEWHARASGKGHRYLAIWNDVNAFKFIFVPDWPTLVKLQALAAPIIQLSLTEDRLSVLEGLARKSFRAWHGHSDHDVCFECDPEQAKSIADAALRNAAKKTKPAS